MRVAVICRGGADDAERILVDVLGRWVGLQPNEVKEIDERKVEFEVGTVSVRRIDGEGKRDAVCETSCGTSIGGGKTRRIHILPDLEQGELLIGTDEEGRTDRSIRHDDV